eukprot:TRINITY_DN129_c1_g3_i1.p1 TRINITY_DN129_c1_g3~~TRINITY_DN129_c1_g3_i1.p1  ORF type:complete len:162 (-),score=49.77 TRINITY_DN129_c1_g3_i1:172-657(-)
MSQLRVVLLTGDNAQIPVDKAVIKMMVTLHNMMEDTEGSDDNILPVPNVSASIMKKIVEFCDHYKNEPQFVESEASERTTDITGWDADFVDVEMPVLFDLILAANYLNIQRLLNLTCKRLSKEIKGKSAEEIRKQFGIPNDFTPEEEEEIRRENSWVEDHI